jgi:hypothetical protein
MSWYHDMTFKPLFLTILCLLVLTSVAHLAFLYSGIRIFRVLSLIFFCLGFATFFFGYFLKVSGRLRK